MRLPSNPDAPKTSENKTETPVTPPVTVNRDPSYPDRARIDSDVRAFLRPVSSPWIVFDRDSRVDDFAKSALRIGAVFASSPSLIEPPKEETVKALAEQASPFCGMTPMTTPKLAIPPSAFIATEPMPMPAPVITEAPSLDPIREGVVLASGMSTNNPEMGMFPTSTTASEPAVEPSNLVVASDVMTDTSEPSLDSLRPAVVDSESDPFAMPDGIAPSLFARRGRLLAIAGGACTAVLALVVVSSVALSKAHVKTASATQAVSMPAAAAAAAPEAAAAAPAAAETIELDAPVPPPPAAADRAGAVEPGTKMPLDPKKRFGKLTIKADAKHKNVWFDGKRMLGSGQRTFMVFCGMHTIAVSDKAETKDIEIPCNGEYTVSK
jgi:hypothetical protein